MRMTRREFIMRVAQTGGSAYAAMVGLKLLPTPQAKAFSLTGQVTGKRVIILGAGLAGMAAAYELGKLGYECQLLEARSRAGGRCWTIRGGDEQTETTGERQVATFDKGLYFNPGPARIPQYHVTLDYCKELGVPVEVFVNANDSAYYYNENVGALSDQRLRVRAARTDLRGHISELLAKAIDQQALDTALTAEDNERLLEFLLREGALSPDDLTYRGSNRRGYTVLPSAGAQPGEEGDPFAFADLLQFAVGSTFQIDAEHTFDFYNFTSEWDQQMPLFQIVGGTDQLAKAFERQVGGQITYQAEVQEIHKSTDGVRILYANAAGEQQELTGDFCICTIPLTVLREIPSDFSASLRQAIASVDYVPAGKLGLQFGRRFWEEDDQIFGGITWTNTDITQIWYPSYGYLDAKGMVIGYYNFGEEAIAVGELAPAERLARAVQEGSKIHPQYGDELEASFSVAWDYIPYSMGGWAAYSPETRGEAYAVLNQPDDRFYLAGEHLSYLTGWMAGALESARTVVNDLHERVLQEAA